MILWTVVRKKNNNCKLKFIGVLDWKDAAVIPVFLIRLIINVKVFQVLPSQSVNPPLKSGWGSWCCSSPAKRHFSASCQTAVELKEMN